MPGHAVHLLLPRLGLTRVGWGCFNTTGTHRALHWHLKAWATLLLAGRWKKHCHIAQCWLHPSPNTDQRHEAVKLVTPTPETCHLQNIHSSLSHVGCVSWLPPARKWGSLRQLGYGIGRDVNLDILRLRGNVELSLSLAEQCFKY